jgi:phage/plasmid-like protein (TIGR03299 family)
MPVETMFSHGTRPWTSLGTALDHPATAREAIDAAGLAWEVGLMPASAMDRPIPRVKAVVRMDRLEPIAVVGERYVPLQNREAFSFFDALIGEGKAVYETAGSLDRGRRIWLLAKLPGDVWVSREDNVGKFLLLTNSHDGGSPLKVLFTPIRVVCENTLLAALGQADKSQQVSIRHQGDILGKAKAAQRLLGITLKYFDEFEFQARHFAARQLTASGLKRYFEDLVPDPKDADPKRAQETRETFVRLFETGRGSDLQSARGTLWGAVNAVAAFVDHERKSRPGEMSEPLTRFKSALFGTGAELKERAWKEALAIMG